MNKFKVAFIGAGDRSSSVTYPSFNALENVEIAAICDINIDRLNRNSDKYGVPEERRYGKLGVFDYQRMIKEVKPDAVIAIGQPHTFYDIWEWCLWQGCNLYIEKPFGLSIHQARSLTYIANQKHCTTQVSFQRRSTPLVMQAREECLKRGQIFHSVCKFYKCDRNPALGARDHMMDDCVHSIDTVRWMNGGEVVKVNSISKQIGVPDYNYFNVVLEFDNGSVGVIMNTWASGKRIFAVEMHAPGIYVEAEHEGSAYIYRDGSLTPEVITTAEASHSDDYYVQSGVLLKAKDFVDACINHRPAESDFNDAVKTMKIADTILAQAILN